MRTDPIKNRARRVSNFWTGCRAFDAILSPTEEKGGLYLGAVPDPSSFRASELKELENKDLHLVLTLLTDEELSLYHDQKYARFIENKERIQIKLPDHQAFGHDEYSDFSSIQSALDKIQEKLDLKQNAYVHCRQGIGRSASLVLAYLIIKENYSLDDALALIHEKRPQASPNYKQIRKVCEYNLKNKIDQPSQEGEDHSQLFQALKDFSSSVWREYNHLLLSQNIQELEKFIVDLKNSDSGLFALSPKLVGQLSNVQGENLKTLHDQLLLLVRILLGLTSFVFVFIKNENKQLALLAHIDAINNTLLEAVEKNPALQKDELLTQKNLLEDKSKVAKSAFTRYAEKHNQDADEKNKNQVQAWADKIAEKISLLSQDISFTDLEEIEETILQTVALDSDIIVTELNKVEDLETQLKGISERHQQLPVLFKQGDDVFLYGQRSKDSPKTITKLNSSAFEHLPFPQSGHEPLRFQSYEIPRTMNREIKKGHDPKRPHNILLAILRWFKECFKKWFGVERGKRNLSENLIKNLRRNSSDSILKTSQNLNCFLNRITPRPPHETEDHAKPIASAH